MKKRQAESSTSPFWKPRKTGDQIEGIFQGFELSHLENKKGDHPVNMRLDTGIVTLSTVLVSFFKTSWKKIRAGKTRIKIVYVGLSKKTYYGKNKAKLYTVLMDGKELKQAGFEAKKMEEKELTKFFA